jgi:hypothetical protein
LNRFSLNDNRNRLEFVQTSFDDKTPAFIPPSGSDFVRLFRSKSQEIVESISTMVIDENELDNKAKARDPGYPDDLDHLESRLKSAGQVVMTAAYSQRLSKETDVADHTPISRAALDDSKALVSMTDLPATIEDTLYMEVKTVRDIASADLMEAMHLLETELSIASELKCSTV